MKKYFFEKNHNLFDLILMSNLTLLMRDKYYLVFFIVLVIGVNISAYMKSKLEKSDGK